MISIDLLVHRVPSVSAAAGVPEVALKSLFSVFGVSLSFHSGANLSEEPTRWDEYIEIVNRWHPTPLSLGSPAHLFIGSTWNGEGAGGTNGLLLTPERSAIAVFTASDALRGGSAAVLLQVVAHEICHLLNLTHEHGDAQMPSAECPDSCRSGKPVDIAWMVSGRTQPLGVEGYPLSRISEQVLASAPPSQVLPWGEPFRPVGTEAMDAASSRFEEWRIT